MAIFMSTLSPAMKTAIKINDAGNYENAVPVMASGKYETKVGNMTSPVTLGSEQYIYLEKLHALFLDRRPYRR